MTPPRGGGGRLAALEPTTQWGLLVLMSVAFATAFHASGVPAAFLIGPLLAGILVSTNGGGIKVPALPYLGAQSMAGCLIAHAITANIVLTFLDHWSLFLALVMAIIAASSGLGWLMTRWHVLPGTTAVWGVSPGAATPMMLMAEAYGADVRLVAFMQYLRVVFVAIAAAIISGFWLPPTAGSVTAIHWLRPIDWLAFLETLAVAGFGAWLGRRLRIPAGGFLVPLALGTVLQVADVMRIEQPEVLLVLSFTLLGWSVGLGFTRSVVLHALKAMPQIALSTLILIGFCGGLAYLLTSTLGIDPLTAYFATSPGGIDSVAIIAASAKVDVSFVMALQTSRLIMVLLIGPPLARLVARSTRADPERS